MARVDYYNYETGLPVLVYTIHETDWDAEPSEAELADCGYIDMDDFEAEVKAGIELEKARNAEMAAAREEEQMYDLFWGDDEEAPF